MSDQPQDDTENDGIIDESERTFLPSEKLLAQYLVKHGARHIKAIPEHGEGRHPDALIDGRYVEFKTVQAGATSTTIKLSVNDSLRGKGQAREIIVDTRSAGVLKKKQSTRCGVLRV